MKVPFADDSNKLDKNFYTELLHIIGLEEIKEKSKLKIQRKDETRRDAGSLIENAIAIIETKDCLYKVKNLESYGETRDERLFGVALELCLTWINRVLFLKLLEAQLLDYHNGNRDFRFLDINTIQDFDELFTLFHQVLAKLPQERRENIKAKYSRVPYLNSSLFEINELEADTITIESLKDTIDLSFINSTVLKDTKAKQNGLPTLEYLFAFLDAYDFASEGASSITENNRSLINASVLGKVFEKINGYKDGSIYTPGFITMYMCRQAIRLAVVQKFKDKYEIDIDKFEDLETYVGRFYKTEKVIEFNELINSLHLCDPAVGSGHFLVSSLNEIIAVKSELGILADKNGKVFSDYKIEVNNDELITTHKKTGEFFKYRLHNEKVTDAEAQRLQKTLFHEKQTLIENCLFGVDINPNSVRNLKGDLFNLQNQSNLFGETSVEREKRLKKQIELEKKITDKTREIEDIKASVIYKNAFEWRFEFPEVLDNEGNFLGFDVVIGNPPYISAIELKKSLSEGIYSQLKKDYKTAKGTVDLFIYFFEKGLGLLKTKSNLMFLTPNRYLSASYGATLREYIFNNAQLNEIIDYSDVKVFEEASTYPIITSLTKREFTGQEYQIKIGRYDEEQNQVFYKFTNSEKLNFLESYIWGYLLNDKLPITEKVINKSVSITECAKINATSTASEADEYHNLINQNNGWKLINTGTIDKYESLWGKFLLTDKGERYLKPYLSKTSQSISQNRKTLYSSNKIIIAKIALTTEAFLDAEGDFASINTNCFHTFGNGYNEKYVLAWLNSKLFQYTFECFFEGLKMQGGYLLYSSPNLSKMFIKEIEEKDQQSFVALVDQILELKKAGEDTQDLENEIDRRVYRLYDLTDEEIAIVEGK